MPEEDITFKPIGIRGLVRIRKKLESPESLLKRIGTLMLSQTQRAFSEERLGDRIWPERYPNQSDVKVNVAGAVQDLSKSSNIKKRRFDSRPTLQDTGILKRPFSSSSTAVKFPDKFTVEVGTTVPYASIHQWGGTSTQQITKEVKSNLQKFLKKKSNKPYRKVLGFLFQVDELETTVNQRPFLGITNQLEIDIRKMIEEDFS